MPLERLRQITRAVRVTRLAPSPTGALHLGNARTFVLNWLLARRHGWKIVLRIEDLDGPRIKRGADRGLIKDLQWLGLDWDAGPIYQSARGDLYRSAIEKLIENGLAYACVCTRREVESAASAPHAATCMHGCRRCPRAYGTNLETSLPLVEQPKRSRTSAMSKRRC